MALKMSRKTYWGKPSDIERKWYLVDAEGEVLGRLASGVATMLMGKNKPVYSPNMDTGDYVVVVNSDKIRLTGGKDRKKKHYHHSGYPGGLKETLLQERMEKSPEEVVYHAVRGMLPHNRLGRAMIKKLHVYRGADHPHGAQKPEPLKING